MNTKFSYMYRDASNYKEFNEVVFKGEITDKERNIINSSIDEGFIPSQVGLEDLLSRMVGFPSGDDHVWHEICDITLTKDEATTPISDFVKQFDGIYWDIIKAMEENSLL